MARSFCHGVCGIESVCGVYGVYGVYGVKPVHPRGTRVHRLGGRCHRLSGWTHQWVAAAVGAVAGAGPVAALPPTTEVLSGVNRIS